MTGWITSNKNRFLPDSTPCYGKIAQDAVCIMPNILRQALEESGFDYPKVTRGFKNHGFIETALDTKGHVKMQEPKRINGVLQKCFCIKNIIRGIKSRKHNNHKSIELAICRYVTSGFKGVTFFRKWR